MVVFGYGYRYGYRGRERECSWKILPLTENSDVPRVCTVKSVKQGRDCLLVLRVRKQSLLSLGHLSTSHTYTSVMAPAVKAKKVSQPGVHCVQS